MIFYTENFIKSHKRNPDFRRIQMSGSHDETVRAPVGERKETNDQTDNEKGKSIKVIYNQTH